MTKLPFEVVQSSEELRRALDDFGEAISILRKNIAWDEVEVTSVERLNKIFHAEHCHLTLNPDNGMVLCFGCLYYFDDGDRVLHYVTDGTPLELRGKNVDKLKDAFTFMVAYGLVSPSVSRHVPDEGRDKNSVN